MLNIVALEGRLVADPELKITQQGTNVCKFRIAVERSYAPAGQQRQSDFIDIVAWRHTAEFVCKYFGKGSLIVMDGSIQTRPYEDKNGNKRTAFEVVANGVHFAGSKATRAPGGVQRNDPPVAVPDAVEDDFRVLDDNDDLPF